MVWCTACSRTACSSWQSSTPPTLFLSLIRTQETASPLSSESPALEQLLVLACAESHSLVHQTSALLSLVVLKMCSQGCACCAKTKASWIDHLLRLLLTQFRLMNHFCFVSAVFALLASSDCSCTSPNTSMQTLEKQAPCCVCLCPCFRQNAVHRKCA